MRRASFKHTAAQMRIGAAAARASADGYADLVPGGKDVTRRRGWRWAKVGMFLLAVERCQGIAPGQRVEIFGVIELLDVTRERLHEIGGVGRREVEREGFGELSAMAFERMFCEHMDCTSDTEVARVVFRHVDVRRVRPALLALTAMQADDLELAEHYRNARAA